MTPDLVLLLWTVALAFIQIIVAVLAAHSQVGLAALAGNRERMPELVGWAGRARRAQFNMLESLPLFIALVLMAHIARRTDAVTIMGEQIFLIGRVAYLLVYLAGIPWVRTLAWAVSVLGMLLIFVELL
jgi:uncharacterized MAPEG superfamily protein